MEINITNCQKKISLNKDFDCLINKVVRFVLEFEGVNIDSEISILFVDNREIKSINSKQRGINKETDCLSFPMLEFDNKKVFRDIYSNFEFKEYELDDGKLLLGDIVISMEMASLQSVEFGHSFEREVCYLIIHSLLHLLGYDHMDEEDKRVMRSREKEIIRNLKIFK